LPSRVRVRVRVRVGVRVRVRVRVVLGQGKVHLAVEGGVDAPLVRLVSG
jgi:hypothetical protein